MRLKAKGIFTMKQNLSEEVFTTIVNCLVNEKYNAEKVASESKDIDVNKESIKRIDRALEEIKQMKENCEAEYEIEY